MLRRVVIAAAALLSAFTLPASPANAGSGSLQFWPCFGISMGCVIQEDDIPTACTSVPSGVRSAANSTASTAVGFFASTSACVNDVPLMVLSPGSSVTDLGGAALYRRLER